MTASPYTLSSPVIVYPGMGGWRFLAISKKIGVEIKEKYALKQRGWGSLPVSVTIGSTTWDTSIFPDKQSGSYVLPLKAAVRKAEDISDGDSVRFKILIK